MLTCGFFDSIRSDRRYDAHQISDLFGMLIPNGICSGIGNGFACEVKDAKTVKIRSGLSYFKGYYAYNDKEIEYTIPEDVYPAVGLMGITVESDPIQTEYPVGNRIDLDGIQVSGIKSNVSVSAIRIERQPQTDYPYGNRIDTDYIKVVGDLEAVEESRVGDCYVVLELDTANRIFNVKAINTNDYRSEIHQVLAVCHKSMNHLTVENAVGKTINDEVDPAKWITGLFQHILIDDILDIIEFTEDEFFETFKTEKNDYWDEWLERNRYCLYHQTDGTTQYSRMNSILDTKEDKFITIYDTIQKDTTEASIYVPNLPSDAIISFKNDPYGLIVRELYTSGNYIRVKYEKTNRNYSICLVIR